MLSSINSERRDGAQLTPGISLSSALPIPTPPAPPAPAHPPLHPPTPPQTFHQTFTLYISQIIFIV